jgi:hypothetical protein
MKSCVVTLPWTRIVADTIPLPILREDEQRDNESLAMYLPLKALGKEYKALSYHEVRQTLSLQSKYVYLLAQGVLTSPSHDTLTGRMSVADELWK